MKAQLEVIILAASNPDESLRFYRDHVGLDVDVDYSPTPDFSGRPADARPLSSDK